MIDLLPSPADDALSGRPLERFAVFRGDTLLGHVQTPLGREAWSWRPPGGWAVPTPSGRKGEAIAFLLWYARFPPAARRGIPERVVIHHRAEEDRDAEGR